MGRPAPACRHPTVLRRLYSAPNFIDIARPMRSYSQHLLRGARVELRLRRPPNPGDSASSSPRPIGTPRPAPLGLASAFAVACLGAAAHADSIAPPPAAPATGQSVQTPVGPAPVDLSSLLDPIPASLPQFRADAATPMNSNP